MHKWVVAIVVALTVCTIGGPVVAASSPARDQAVIRRLVNDARAKAGLSGLTEDARLTDIARRQAQRMRDHGAIFHNDNLGPEADASGVNWTVIGENVGVGPQVGTVERAFMNSPAHRRNILDRRYTLIGVGVVDGGGRKWVTQVFARLRDVARRPAAATPAAAKAPATKAVAKKGAPKPVVDSLQVEDGSRVPLSFFMCTVTRAEDGTFVPTAFFGGVC